MIFIALGANLPSRYGTPLETLQAARATFSKKGIQIIKASRTWKTAPVPISDDPWYHNEVVQVETTHSPEALLKALLSIEKEFGRVRSYRNAPRLLDLDIIAYHNQVIDKDDLIIPHPRMHERAFVLYPMADIDGHWVHPKTGVNIQAYMKALSKDQKIELA